MRTDTRTAIEQRLVEGLRRMSPAAKFGQIEGLFAMAEALAEADVRRLHPHASDWEVRWRVASRRLPPELLKAALGWYMAQRGF